MIKVNLVPAEILAKARQRQLVLQASVIGSLLGLVLVMLSFFHWFGLYRLQDEFASKEAKLQKLAAIVAQVEELEKAAQAVRARLGVIEDLLKGRGFYPIFMSEFAKTVPAGVRVTSLGTSIAGAGTLKLAIAGTAPSSEEIALWVKTLEKNGHFKPVELGPIQGSGPRLYNFTIATTYSNKP